MSLINEENLPKEQEQQEKEVQEMPQDEQGGHDENEDDYDDYDGGYDYYEDLHRDYEEVVESVPEKPSTPPMFANHTVMNAESCYDFLRLSWSKTSGIARIVLFGAGSGAIIYASTMLWEVGTSTLIFAIFAYLMGLTALFTVFFGWLVRSKKYIQQQKELWQGETLEKDVLFYKNFILQESKLGRQSYYYKDITELRHNKRCLVISMSGRALLIRKDGFAQGDFEKVLALLKEKIKQNKGG